MIPFNIPNVPEKSKQYVMQALESPHQQGDGPFTTKVTELISNLVGGGNVLLTPSCTHALEMASMLAEIGPGDEVILPSYTFTSAATAITKFGATPVFVDIEPESKGIAVDQVRHAITNKTKAISWVNYAGVAPDVDGLLGLAKDFDLLLIEDNAHGLFAKYRGKYLGTFGALATQSFHETKNITCGEGGALVINDASLAERAEILREKGTDRTKFLRGQVDKYTWVDTGSSWVISDLLAAILFGQLSRADEIYKQRMNIWNRYHTELETWAWNNNVVLPTVPEGCEHTGHVYHLRFQRGDQRDKFIEHLKRLGIYAVFHYQPLHLSTVGRTLGGRDGQFPFTESAGDCLVRLPLFNALTNDEQTYIIESVTAFSPGS